MKRFLLSAALLLACSGVALAQESEFSGGGGGGITAAPGSGTAGRVPQFASTTSLEDSKMTTSGTNSGTWTLYDPTLVNGSTNLRIRRGVGQSGAEFLVDEAGGAGNLFEVNGYGVTIGTAGTGIVFQGNTGEVTLGSTGFLQASSYANFTVTNPNLKWPNATPTVGLNYSAAGILKITDGSTGQGGIGIADSATNTVSDALILRHQGGTVDVGFGTGLLFQAENEAGTMHTIAGIDAVWVDDVDATEDSDLKFYTMEAGQKVLVATMNANDPSLASRSLSFNGVGGIEAGSFLTLESGPGTNIRFGTTGVAQRWVINGTTGHFHPDASFSNTYDIGTSSALVRNNYVSTSIQGVRAEVIPSDNVAENFVVITAATSDAVTNGYIEYTVTAVDTTNHIIQTETGMVPFVAVNENGTVTASLGTPYGVHQDNAGGGALVVSFGSSVATTNVTFTVTSNYDEATLTGTVVNTFRYRVVLTSGTATVTPDT